MSSSRSSSTKSSKKSSTSSQGKSLHAVSKKPFKTVSKQSKWSQIPDKKRQLNGKIHDFIIRHHRLNLMERKIRTPDPLSVRSLYSLDPRSYEPLSEESTGFAGTFVNPLTVYRFRLGGYTTLSQTSGVVNAFLAADPSASGWNSPEWATLSALFSEFRLVSLSVRVLRAYNVTVTNNISALAICSNLGTAANPGSYAAVADNADATFYSYVETGRYVDGKCGQVHTMHGTGLNWSQVTTPTVEPYAGAPGSIQFYSDNTTAAGTLANVFQVLIAGTYDFRVRV